MQNGSRRNPLHRHLLVAFVATLIAAPSAFAHSHHADSHRSASRASFGHGHHSRNDRSQDTRYGSSQGNDGQTVAALSDRRPHERVPDEEELEQAEQ